MDKLHNKYLSILKKEKKKVNKVPEIIELDNKKDKEIIKSHIKEHFYYAGSVKKDHIDEYLDIKKTTKGYDCKVLVECHNGKIDKSFYFEVHSTDEEKARNVLGSLEPGEELHIHIKGKDYQEVSKKLSKYLPKEIKEEVSENGYSKVKVKITNRAGLHIRPVGMLVQEANKYNAEIYITYEDLDQKVGRKINNNYYADAKSALEVLQLGAGYGKTLEIIAKGKDSEKALKSLENLVKSGFNEN